MSGWADIRAQARRTVHATFAGPVSYDGVTGLTARWGNKLAVGGNGDLSGEYGAMLEGIDRLVFCRDELDAYGITLAKNGRVVLLDYGKTFLLDTPLPDNGPVTKTWLVVDADD